ncbi:hypothetical protein KY1_01975 [Salmonella enterica subsp. enterica serovar Cerro str. FSL R8-0235]|nr:hypothetical protein KY1_01975 [Salmonella enterica subsp. enterica serovar Cerro str. FSL R8-0235]
MPSSSVSAMIFQPYTSIPSSSATSGESIISGRPVTAQWASTFASTTAGSGTGSSISCSRLPSCRSSRNSRSSASSEASSAATWMMPGAIRAALYICGPTRRIKVSL